MPELSVIITVFNEEELIFDLYQRLGLALTGVTPDYELIFVNDGGSALLQNRIENLCQKDQKIKYIQLSRNFGHQVAVCARLDYCKGRAVVVMDGDLQDPPEVIPELYQKFSEGFDVVYARRVKRKGESLFKRGTAGIFYRLLKSITSIDIPVDTGDFRIMNRRIVDELKRMPERSKFLRGQIAWLGFRQTFVNFERDCRQAGKTTYSLGKMVKFSLDGITAFSDVPLKLVTFLGLFISFAAFLIILYALYSHFWIHRTVTGWTSLIISSAFLGGIQLLSIGILGEYISRISVDVRRRPLYVVSGTNMDDSRMRKENNDF